MSAGGCLEKKESTKGAKGHRVKSNLKYLLNVGSVSCAMN